MIEASNAKVYMQDQQANYESFKIWRKVDKKHQEIIKNR